MILKQRSKLVIPLLTMFALSLLVSADTRQPSRRFRDALGPKYRPQDDLPVQSGGLSLQAAGGGSIIRRWNRISIDASGLDHTPVAPGEVRVFGEQLGPGRSSRAIAIMHIAIFDVLNAISGGFQSYTGISKAVSGTSANAAVAQAAHDTLVVLFPSQKLTFDLRLGEDLALIPNGAAKTNGISLGKLEAKTLLQLRANDGSQIPEPRFGINYIPGGLPGEWRQDPISLIPLALGARWGEVKPLAIISGSQFRVPPPPPMGSAAYATAYNEVKQLGGDGIITPTVRSATQTEIGIYWAYDGTPSLCAPPRLYNQIAMHIADQMGTDGIQLARLLALANTAMADAGIAIWESKYFYDFWRPVGGIRESDPGTGPTGIGDGNPSTVGDPLFMPLGAPASNLTGPNFTPPFPAYPSGHAGFGGALFETLRKFYGTDNIPFTFVSDEFNGITKDNGGNIRPLKTRSFSSFSQAEEENGQSRIYLGIHWAFDKTEGIAQGRRVADFVFKNKFRKLP